MILFYTASSGNELEGVVALCDNKLTLRKRHFFVIEKHIEDAKHEEKDVPDLLESIMRSTDPVKEELTARKPACKKTHIFHPSSQAPAQARAPAKKDGKFKLAA